MLTCLLAAGFVACDSGTTEPALTVDVSRPECENLNPLHCLLPWPSSRYLADDATTATGKRIALPAEAMPSNRWGERIDPASFGRYDGFTAMTSMVTVLAGRIDISNLPAENRIPESLTDDSPTVLIDADSGARVGHFSELDGWEGSVPERTAFYIRPAQRLEENRRYIVAIRKVKTIAGNLVPPSNYFRVLRDNLPTDTTSLSDRKAHFEDIFGKLKAAGIERDDLIEAWDFHTASGASLWSDMVAIRDDAMQRVGARGLGCTVKRVREDYGNQEIFRRVEGSFTVPLYMETSSAGASLNRGVDGLVQYNGTAEAPFVAVIPWSVKNRMEAGGAPARLMTYGHGLMGDGGQVASSGTRSILERFEIVGVATDWWGMAEEDTNNVANVLGQLGDFPTVTDRMKQGVANTLVLTRSFAGVCADLLEIEIGGRSVIDPDEKYYLGISQGAIMGTTVAALSQDIDRFILNVGGVSYPIMILRSVDFPDYSSILRAWYDDKLDSDLMMVAVAQHWDTVEPSTYASHLLANPLPGSTTKRILYQTGLYDAQVPNISSDIAARTMGLPYLSPASAYDVWNLPKATAPVDSAYVIYDVGATPVPIGSIAAESDNAAHSGVRREDTAQRQMDAFMRPDGRVEDFCNGRCDPD